jgi:hypothetical protein
LVVAAGNEPTKHTSFPVLLKQPSLLQVFGGVTPAALAVVEDLQPYQSPSPEAHPLAVLNGLWNIDKHRSLHLAVAKIGGTQIFLQSESSGTLLGGQFQPGPLGDDDIIGVFEFSGEPPLDTDVIASGSSFVAFGEEGPWGTDRAMLEILERLHQFVTNVVVPRVESLLASG